MPFTGLCGHSRRHGAVLVPQQRSLPVLPVATAAGVAIAAAAVAAVAAALATVAATVAATATRPTGLRVRGYVHLPERL